VNRVAATAVGFGKAASVKILEADYPASNRFLRPCCLAFGAVDLPCRRDNTEADIVVPITETHLVVGLRLKKDVLRRGYTGAATDNRLGLITVVLAPFPYVTNHVVKSPCVRSDTVGHRPDRVVNITYENNRVGIKNFILLIRLVYNCSSRFYWKRRHFAVFIAVPLVRGLLPDGSPDMGMVSDLRDSVTPGLYAA
jgi:hypothetical protein